MYDLNFEPMPEHERGTILRLLQESYRGLPRISEELFQEWELAWKGYEEAVFACPDTVGASGFVTHLGASIIGFASWDPRQHPTALVGHNCILPAFRRNGYGKRQIEEVLARLGALGFTRVWVTTGDHPGFMAARKMYLACGFRETRRFFKPTKTDPGWIMVEFEKELPNHRL